LRLARQDELSAALHVNRTTLYRQSRKVKAEGVLGVVDRKRGPQGPQRFTRAKREQAQRLLAQGHSIRKTGQQVEVERLAACAKRVPLNTLLDEQEIVRLAPEAKHFTDTIKMLAFQAETALVLCLTLNGVPTEDGGRALVREMLLSSADIVPQAEEQRLLVRAHSLASPRHNHALAKLCETLNSLEIRYPGTDLMLAYGAPQGA
jgi:hypothetical protein